MSDDPITFWTSKVKVTAGVEAKSCEPPYLVNFFSSLDVSYKG